VHHITHRFYVCRRVYDGEVDDLKSTASERYLPVDPSLMAHSAGRYGETNSCYRTGTNRFPRRLATGIGRGDWRCCVAHKPQIDPKQVYREVDWGPLLFFAGLFVILAGAEAAGITQQLLAVAGHSYLRNSLVFAGLVSLRSNIVSNVPAVMLQRPMISNFQNEHDAWLLSMASTLAGNLTITGSVANIIVAEKARPDVHISFMKYLRIGVPATMLTLSAGLLWLSFVRY
jgi:di/tricarboxylate transporter